MDATHQMLYYAEPGITTSDSTTCLSDLTSHKAARWMHQSSLQSAPKAHNPKDFRPSVLPPPGTVVRGSLKTTHSLQRLQTIPEEALVQYQDIIHQTPDANQPLQIVKGDDSVGGRRRKSPIKLPFSAAELPAMLVSDMADGQRLHETISPTEYPQDMSSPNPSHSSPSLQPMSISSSPRSMPVSQGDSDMQSASALSSQPSSPNTDLSRPRRSSRRRIQRVELTGPYLVPHGYTATSPQSSGSQDTNSQRENSGGRRRNGQVAESTRATRSRGRRRRIASSSDVSNHDDSSSTTGGTASIDSDLSCEVTIFTKGTSVLAGPTCPFCYKMLEGTEEQIYAHGNECLDQLDCKDDQQAGRSSGKMVSYVFEGVERVRAASLFEGSLSAEFGCGPAHMDEKNDEDVDVDQDDVEYGHAQYTDGDLIIPSTNDDPQCNTSHLRTLEDPQAEEEVMLAEEQVVELSNQDSSENRNQDHGRTHPDMAMTNGAAQLVIDALKARIREQDKLLESVPKCAGCYETFKRPCVSINCWHVFCESCWMSTLGSKKLCPQCMHITQPADLRRIYM
ncbi:hypothetical protein COEREDRAFT_83284 [Coemansia reversa NRRL 1564]|uniref:RING-type domain-containing protein n=1 Tax=Coemansia reversa (strain ATCC 12441 / NRRL 1564) TaxID=763665 RepID=A0A2G5B3V7_COERN|nr:hypothetical protein COEREDRAFT_83284 [Coemansia reversa NRRL 1564]|eukprot:PIA13681.1 hypothetical protein COEREDRAFT_83284 [Coemansia reversa NRRL 1564]